MSTVTTGMWPHATSQLHDSAVSHTSYVITYCGCPIHWVSKLQSAIVLSTTEAGYIAFSMCLCDLLPMHTLLTKLTKHFNFGVPSDVTLTQHTTVDTCMHQSMIFEDNTGCLELANKPDQVCPWTRHISIKWHHFWDAVKNGSVVVQMIDTTLQLADPLTKPLPHPWFEQLRWLLMGWWQLSDLAWFILSLHNMLSFSTLWFSFAFVILYSFVVTVHDRTLALVRSWWSKSKLCTVTFTHRVLILTQWKPTL